MQAPTENICIYDAKIKNGDEFVGIRMENGFPRVYFPTGYRHAKDIREQRRDILNLISVLSVYGNRNEFKPSTYGNNSQVFPIHAYIGVFTYYLNYGYFSEREAVYNRRRTGKIDWGRTVKQIQPQWSQDDPIYLEYIVKRSTSNETSLLTQIHQYCVYEAYQRLGCLFTATEPAKPSIKYNEALFVSVLQAKIASSFNEKHLTLFKQMLDIIRSLGTDGNRNIQFYGTNDFEYIWEGLIDKVFGISPKDRREYYPKTTWHLENGTSTDVDTELEKSALRPDTIMLYKRNDIPGIYILDAKYYRYGITKQPTSLPGSSSINKQFTYAEYVETLECAKDSRIYNAFIMPYNADAANNAADYGIKNIGYATGNWKQNGKTYEKIHGILLDVKTLMHSHTRHPTKAMDRLAELIETA